LQSLTDFLQVIGRRAQGPSPTFERAHLLLAFITIGESRTIGRGALAKRVGLGEGAIRTILKRLRDDGYMEVNASGCSLTKDGLAAYRALRKLIPGRLRLDSTTLTVGRKQVALLVRGGGGRVGNGIPQRDAAIKVGASGATTYLLRDSRFQIPGDSSDCEKDFPSPVWKKLRRELGPTDGDAIIVCGAEEELLSEIGALSAAITLLR